MNKKTHKFDFCVIGGGMAGLCAAIAAAREGAKTAIVQDRPVFGGNSSSETRVHVCGADRHGKIPNVRETGILEEMRLENQRRNPQKSYSIWDTILYEKVLLEGPAMLRERGSVQTQGPGAHSSSRSIAGGGLTHFLNCSILDARMDGPRIASVTGWQLTTYTYHTIEAAIFADCSGDGILAPLTGAQYRVGREAASEFSESHQPEVADRKTMGMTCLFQARDMGSPQPFEPPSWAYDFPTEDSFPHRSHGWIEMGYWWLELGGEQDSIADTEAVRDELLKIVYGMWDHIKNHGDHGAANYALDWVQFLPAKRESRRYVGDHLLTQNDIESEGHFDDIVCHGGWPMDDHHPGGFWYKGAPTIFYPTPSPYGISYRCLCSKNVENLMFAGRCASWTHAALSSTRIQATGAVAGQAVGTAAAIAVREKITPRSVGRRYLDELQQSLLKQDAYLPWVKQRFSDLTMKATLRASSGDPAPLLDGTNRAVGDDAHAWTGKPGDTLDYTWDAPQLVKSAAFIFDSSLDKLIAMSHHGRYGALEGVPETIVKDFRVEVRSGGEWQPWREVEGNYQRLVRVDIGAEVNGVRAVFDSTWGSEAVRLFAFWLE